MADGLDVQGLAVAYRRLVLWFGLQLLLVAGYGFESLAGEGPAGHLLAIGLLVVRLATFVALAIYGYRTATALGSTVGWVWGIAMVVPIVNLVALLVLSTKATRACRAHGVPVGFLGPKSPADGEIL